MKHFKEVCRSARGSVVHNTEQEAYQEQENHTEMVNIGSVNFNADCSIITANLKTSSENVVITVPCKVDMGSIIISQGTKRAIGGNKKYKYQTKNI